ncbi:MAG: response regulator [Deltaproteobacteria bacterium]|nr:response regulator [Deltaproteobacteria bacterium]
MSTPQYTLLVVDDEENIRWLYKEELEEEGYIISAAASGEEAMKMLPEVNPDLVVMDIKMPGMSGVETLIKMKEIDRNIPVILCSAYGEYKQDFSTWASDAYVVKAASLDELKKAIREVLAKRYPAETDAGGK